MYIIKHSLSNLRCAKHFHGTYDLTVGGDDGYRLSIVGGNSYVIDNYTNHPYQTRTVSGALGGSHDLVLEYYQDGGGNRVSFDLFTLIAAHLVPLMAIRYSVVIAPSIQRRSQVLVMLILWGSFHLSMAIFNRWDHI